MKIEIFDEKKEPEKVLRLRLVEVDGCVQLYTVDENGERIFTGVLLSIDNDGLYRFRGVNPKFGLPLDDDGRIKLNEGWTE